MTTVLRASPRRFVSTPSVERIAARALRYLQSGYSVHLRGPAGTGKTTLGLHLADLLARPIMLVFGDDEFKTSDLIGNQSGYVRKKVVDNFIHSVVKVEDELRQNWVDSRLTLACREGFTLVYDEFNRSRPEVNNVLLSALEEKLLVLPPSNNRSEYIRVNPHFRAIFTSNPEEYCGVHATQDALLDRLVTINMPEPDELTQQEILVQKTEISRTSAVLIVQLVKAFRVRTQNEKASGLRSCLMLAKVCHDHEILAHPGNADFRDLCCDVLLSRTNLPLPEATTALWELLNEFAFANSDELDLLTAPDHEVNSKLLDSASTASVESLIETLNPLKIDTVNSAVIAESAPPVETVSEHPDVLTELSTTDQEVPATLPAQETAETEACITELPTEQVYEQAILTFIQQANGARLSEIEAALKLDRFQTVDTLRTLVQKGQIYQHDRHFLVKGSEA